MEMETASESGGQDYVELIELGKQLIAASRVGNVDAAVRLMHYGAPFATDWWGMTALHHAALHGHLEVASLLVSSGILKDTRSKVDKTPLHLTCQEGHSSVAQYLIANGAEVNAVDMLFMTPLHWAVEMNHLETVKILLQHGAQPNLPNKFDKTAFDIAASKAFYDIFVVLKESAQSSNYADNPNISYDKGKIKTYTPVKGKKAIMGNGTTKNDVSLPKNDEVWELLEQHGIEMLEGEDVNLVAAALGNGQNVYLTEAGRQALSLTRRNRQISAGNAVGKQATASPAVSIRQSGVSASPLITLAKKGKSVNHIIVNSNKVSQASINVVDGDKSRLEGNLSSLHSTEQNTAKRKRLNSKQVINDSVNEALVAGFYEKFMQAKKDAKHHHTMYLKKRKEAEHYLKKLTLTVKSISDSDSNEVKLLNSHLNVAPNSFLDEEDLVNDNNANGAHNDDDDDEDDNESGDFIDEPLDNL